MPIDKYRFDEQYKSLTIEELQEDLDSRKELYNRDYARGGKCTHRGIRYKSNYIYLDRMEEILREKKEARYKKWRKVR